MYEPAIKWSGSKRSQAEEIVKRFPQEIDVYYEPFCGGCSVLRRLLESNIKVNRYICSDLNNDLINLWNEIKNNPYKISEHYTNLWNELNIDNNIERKKQYFYKIRKRFNEEKSPLDFMFIMRVCLNGMPRYNNKGEFNTSFHITRNGIIPKTLLKTILEWNELLNKNNVEFKHCSYDKINANKNDFIYLDPPYANTKGMYYGALDNDNLWNWMRKQKSAYILSFDGSTNNEDNTFNVPTDLYVKHEYLLSGNSSFRRINKKSNDTLVNESLYIK